MVGMTMTSPMTGPAPARSTRAGRGQLGPTARKIVLVTHVLAVATWIGIDVLFAILVLTGWFSDDPATRGLAYEALGTFVVAPMLAAAVACLATGVALGLGTKWGLTRYWWVTTKLALTVAMCALVTFVLTPGMAEVRLIGQSLTDGSATGTAPGDLFFAPAMSLSLLTFAVVLSVFKPWGRVAKRRNG